MGKSLPDRKVYVIYKKLLHNLSNWQAYACQILVYVKCRISDSYLTSVEIQLNIQNTFFSVNQVS